MQSAELKTVNFRKVAVGATAIFIIDAYFMGQGVLAGITLFISGLIFLPLYIYKRIKHSGKIEYIWKHLIYAFASLLVFLSYYANNKLAIYRSELLVHNIELYKKENGSYPERLQQLVPKYYTSIPEAKISSWGKFFYHYENGKNPSLFYIIYPPFYRNGYNFQNKQWHSFD